MKRDSRNPAERIRIGVHNRRAVYIDYAALDRIAKKYPAAYLRAVETIHRTLKSPDSSSQSGNACTVSMGTVTVRLSREAGNLPWYYVSSSIE